ncbi:MAG: hypothetical protein ACI30W_00255 [Muribaculaceae bacterium]
MKRLSGGKVASFRLYGLVTADRGLRPPPAALPPANAQRALQARRGNGFQPEVSGDSWGPRPDGAAAGAEHSEGAEGSGAVVSASEGGVEIVGLMEYRTM